VGGGGWGLGLLRRRGSAVALGPLVVAAALAAAGCHRADSVLLVEVAGDVTLPVAQLSANVTIGTTTHMLLVPPAPTSISLPTSFTVALSRDLTGPVTVAIDALDDTGALLASGQTVQQHIDVGDDTVIPVKLGSADPVMDDAGAPTP
jgi:hypothetical protein